MVLVWIAAIAFAVFAGWICDSVIAGIIVFFVALGFFTMKWNEAGATINMATQHKRDKEILEELKKMNQDKE